MAFRTTSALIAALLMTSAPSVLLAQTAAPSPAADAPAAAPAETAPSAEATPTPETAPAPDAAGAPAADAAPTPEAPAADAPATDAAPMSADTPAAGTPEAAGAATTGAAAAASRDDAQVGGYYADSTHGEWTLRCLKAPEGTDPCELYQLMQDAQGNPVSEISMVPLEGQAVAGATIVAPLETDLVAGVGVQVDAGKPLRYPFSFCAPVGCVSRVGFTQAEFDAMKRGKKATVTLVPYGAGEEARVDLDLSLTGFTAGMDALKAKMPAPKQ